MRQRLAAAVVVCALVSGGVPGRASETSRWYVLHGRGVVDEIESIVRAHGGRVDGVVESLRLLKVRAAPATAAALRSAPLVEWVRRERMLRVAGVRPNDPLFARQWPLETMDAVARVARRAGRRGQDRGPRGHDAPGHGGHGRERDSGDRGAGALRDRPAADDRGEVRGRAGLPGLDGDGVRLPRVAPRRRLPIASRPSGACGANVDPGHRWPGRLDSEVQSRPGPTRRT